MKQLSDAFFEEEKLTAKPESRFLPWVCAGILVGLLIVLYLPIVAGMVRDWWDDANYSHGFLVPFFSGYLIWQRRSDLEGTARETNWLGLLLLMAGLCGLILGDFAAEDFTSRSSLIIVVAGLVLFHFGTGIFKIIAFPLAFLFFMVPLPVIVFNAVALPLQSLAAQGSAWTLDLLGIPVLLDGNVIHLSHISLGVTEACSGIRSLISLLACAVAWVCLTPQRFWQSLLFIAAVVPITIVANSVRVVATGLTGQWFGVGSAQGLFHIFSGWLIFVFAIFCLAVFQALIRALGSSRRRKLA
jgi:exosortase